MRIEVLVDASCSGSVGGKEQSFQRRKGLALDSFLKIAKDRIQTADMIAASSAAVIPTAADTRAPDD